MMNIGAIIVVIFASLLKGVTGFGFTLVALPFLLIWYSPKELIPILMICNLLSSLFIILQKKDTRLVSRSFRTLIIYGGVFTVFGVLALKYLSDNHIIHILGIFFVGLTVLTLINKRLKITFNNRSYKVAGAFIGFLTGSISVSGPPLALFLNMANVNSREFREIFSWFSVVSATVAIFGYAHLGMITGETIKVSLFILPILFAGSFIGKRLISIMPSEIFRQFSLWLTLLVSLFLLIK